jgi:hypothetical protein
MSPSTQAKLTATVPGRRRERDSQIQGRIKYVHNEIRKGRKRNIAKFVNKK